MNTNFPWRILEGGEEVNKKLSNDYNYTTTAEDTCIVDKDGFEVVGCSEWMRGEENFERIVLSVNALSHLSLEELKNFSIAEHSTKC